MNQQEKLKLLKDLKKMVHQFQETGTEQTLQKISTICAELDSSPETLDLMRQVFSLSPLNMVSVTTESLGGKKQ